MKQKANKDLRSISVIGGGSWATALVKLLLENIPSLTWFMRNKEGIDNIKKYRHNPNYLSSIEFDPSRLNLTSDLKKALESDIILLAIPAAFLKGAFEKVEPSMLKGKIIFSAVKGIIPEGNLIPGLFLNQHYGVPMDSIGVITGPCHAEEVALERLSYLTIASEDPAKAELLCKALTCRYLKASPSDDIIGTEYSAVLKNIFALATGISIGLGYGDNYRAVLISNAIQEIERFVERVHPIQRDINSSAYLGDLLVTAYSQFSRNRAFGIMIGKGYSVKYAQIEMNMIAEGYYAARCIHEINRDLNVHMPITTAVYHMLYEKISPSIEMKILSEHLA